MDFASEEHIDEKFLPRLKKEVRSWVTAGIIGEAVRNQILAQYGDLYQAEIKNQRQARLSYIISIFGAILVGAGVLLYIGANWDYLPKGIKLLIIFSSIAFAYGIGMWLRMRSYERIGLVVLFLGSLFYGAGIALIAQIYNIQAQSGGLFLLWGSGVFLSGWALSSTLFLCFSSILFTPYKFYRAWMTLISQAGVVLAADESDKPFSVVQ